MENSFASLKINNEYIFFYNINVVVLKWFHNGIESNQRHFKPQCPLCFLHIFVYTSHYFNTSMYAIKDSFDAHTSRFLDFHRIMCTSSICLRLCFILSEWCTIECIAFQYFSLRTELIFDKHCWNWKRLWAFALKLCIYQKIVIESIRDTNFQHLSCHGNAKVIIIGNIK